MDSSSGFGSTPCAWTLISNSLSLRLPYPVNLATECKSLTHYAKGTQSPPKKAPTVCMHAVSGSISLPSPGFFSPFPHGTASLSVSQEYLALEDGPPFFKQDFSCPALLVVSLVSQANLQIRDYHPLRSDFPVCSSNSLAITNGSSAFARRYLQNLG